MPRFILFLFVFFSLCFSVRAQDFKAGWIAGINASQVDGDNLSGYNKLGPQLGIFVERGFGTRFSLRPEFLFTIKGAKEYLLPDSAVTPLKAGYYYVEVPLMLSYKIKKWGVEAGPSFGVLLYSFTRSQFGKENTTSRHDRLEWAAHLGVTYALNPRIRVYGRFSYSVDCVSGTNCGSLFTNPKLRPGLFHNLLTLGFRGNFGS